MNLLRTRVVAAMACAISASLVLAEDIKLGDDAPQLQIKEWVKGKPVDLKDGKHVYVVEFWATWCGPCINSMPHLSELQQKHAKDGVIVVGVTKQDRSQELKDVKKFVDGSGDRMQYTVAFDDGTATYDAYMKAFKKNGIPQSFVIDKKGKIVWEGHPMMGLDAVVEKILTGNYDVDSLAAVANKAKEEMMARQKAISEKFEKYFEAVGASKEAEGARKIGDELLVMLKGDAMSLNAFSWRILDDDKVMARDLDLAMKAAQAAYEASNGEDASIVDTYARALWDTGEKEKAITYQRKAVELATTDRMKEELEKTLHKYEKEAGKK